MNTKHKDLYEAPSMMIVEVEQEGVICASLTDPTDYQFEEDPFAF